MRQKNKEISLSFPPRQWPCVMLHLILHYFLLTNYAWMLCEGFYLHTVLVYAFISEQKLTRWLIALGWSAPAVFLILYGTLRGFFSVDQDRILLVIHGNTQISHVISLMNILDVGWTRVHTRTFSSLQSAYQCYLISFSCATSCELFCLSSVLQLRCRMVLTVDRRGIFCKLLGEFLWEWELGI